MGRDNTSDFCESMDSMMTHILGGMQQGRYVVRWLRRHRFDNYSQARWYAMSTVRRKMAMDIDDHSHPR